MPAPFDPEPMEELSAAALRRLVGELRAEAARLQDENAALKDEIAWLKGLEPV